MSECIIKIRCGNCGKTWKVNWRYAGRPDAHICPNCGAAVDRYLWNRDVLSAAAGALDCNMELERDATGYNKPRFKINFLCGKGKDKSEWIN